jgi:hypothetical protein
MYASHSHTRQVKWRVFLAGFPRGDPESAEFTRRCDPPFWAATFRGEGGVICVLISVREEKSATATHVEQKGLCSFTLKFTAAQ